jgi:hypothetical protein
MHMEKGLREVEQLNQRLNDVHCFLTMLERVEWKVFIDGRIRVLCIDWRPTFTWHRLVTRSTRDRGAVSTKEARR